MYINFWVFMFIGAVGILVGLIIGYQWRTLETVRCYLSPEQETMYQEEEPDTDHDARAWRLLEGCDFL